MLAVAFVVLAAVPSVATDSDADTATGIEGSALLATENNAYADVTKKTDDTEYTAGVYTVTLKQNVALNSALVLEENLSYTFNLGDYTITNTTGSVFSTTERDCDNISLTVTAGKGGITAKECAIVISYSEKFYLSVDGGAYKAQDNDVIRVYAKDQSADITVRILNCTIDATSGTRGVGIWLSNSAIKDAVISNCTINAFDTGIYAATFLNTPVTRTDGSTASTAACVIQDCKVTVTGEKAYAALELKAGTIDIIGGEFSSSVYVDSVATRNENGGGPAMDTIAINNSYCSASGASSTTVTITGAKITQTATAGASTPIHVGVVPGSYAYPITLNMDESYGVAVAYGKASPEAAAVSISVGSTPVPVIDGAYNAGGDAESRLTYIGTALTVTEGTVAVGDVSIASGSKLAVSEKAALSLASGKLVISKNASVVNNGTITGSSAAVYNYGTLTNNGTMTVDSNLKLVAGASSTSVLGDQSDLTKTDDVYSINGLSYYAGARITAYKSTETAIGTKDTPVTISTKDAAGTDDVKVSADDAQTFLDAGAEEVVLEGDFTVSAATSAAPAETLVVKGSSLTGTIKNGTTDSVSVSNLKGQYSIVAGSVQIDGTDISSGEITVTSGTGALSGTLSGELKVIVEDNATLDLRNLNILSGAVLTIEFKGGNSKAVVAAGEYVNLYGTIKASGTNAVTITVAEKTADKAAAKFTAYSGASLVGISVDGEGTIDLSKAQGTYQLIGEIMNDLPIGQLQNVEVSADATIRNSSTVTIMGSLVIDEGRTLTIEKGSRVVVDSVTATVSILGKVIVEDGAEFVVTKARSVEIAGTLQSEGKVTINSTTKVLRGGSLDIEDAENSSIEVSGGLEIASGATLTVKGKMKITDIRNSGSIVMDGASLSAATTISLVASGASVDVKSVAGAHSLTVNDNGLKVNTKTADYDDSVSFTPGTAIVKGLTIVSDASYSSAEDKVVKILLVSGSVTAAADDGSAVATAIALSGKTVVADALDLGKKITLETVAGADLKVAGTITATSEGSRVVLASGSAMEVTGTVQTISKIDEVSAISGASYTAKLNSKDNWFYTTLSNAVASGATSITVYGKTTVEEDLEVPAGTAVIVNDTLTVGTSADRSVVLTVKDGASLRNGTIVVLGTLVFENSKDNKVGTIESDVKVESGSGVKYTNVYTAVAGAVSGDTVTVTAAQVVLDADISIGEGVTLDVPITSALVALAGTTITVEGTLSVYNAIAVQKSASDTTAGTFASKASADENRAAIVVDGVFRSSAAASYAAYSVAGAYYTMTTDEGQYHYITSLATAASFGSDAGDVEVYGKVSSQDVAFTGTSSTSTQTVKVMSGAQLSVTKLTLTDAVLKVDGTKTDRTSFTGAVAVGDAAVSLKGIYKAEIGSVNGASAGLVIASMTVDNDKDGTYAASVVSGTVYIRDVDGTAATTVGTGSSARTYHSTLTVMDGAAIAPAAGTTRASGDVSGVLLDLQGAFVVGNDEEFAVGTAVVTGTVSVALKDTAASKQAGKLTFDMLYIGVSQKDTTGADVAVDGPLTYNSGAVAIVSASAVLSEETLASLTTPNDYHTEYYVEDSLWITVYAESSNAFRIGEIVNAPIVNGDFKDQWRVGRTNANDYFVGADGYQKVTAYADYEVYALVIVTDGGVGRVTINNVLMAMKDNTFYATNLVAGDYKIEFSAATGYDVSKVTLTDSKGAAVSGTTVTLSGTDGTKATTGYGSGFYTSEYQLVGSTAVSSSGGSSDFSGIIDAIDKNTDAVKDQDRNITVNGDDGSSLTNILLIVLVVLILVMAILVAMRMMRS